MPAPLALAGLGTALPGQSMPQETAAAVISRLTGVDRDWTVNLFRASKIDRRHLSIPKVAVADALAGTDVSGSSFTPHPDRPAGPGTADRMAIYAAEAPRLAADAANAALADAALRPDKVSHLVTVTCTGFASPGVDFALIRDLGLPPGCERVQVGFMGCHGAVNGLRAARGLLATAEPGTAALVVCVELCSLHFDYRYGAAGMVPNALFADGAAAAVLRNADGDGWSLAATGSRWWPGTADAMTWRIGDHGFEMTLSPQVPSLIARHLRPWLEEWLNGHGLDVSRVGSWAVHPGGSRILDAVEGALSLPPAATAASRRVLAECGNMSSPTVLFVLDRLRAAGAPRPCVALAFGPGLVAEAVLFV